jgi:hypothetical protein
MIKMRMNSQTHQNLKMILRNYQEKTPSFKHNNLNNIYLKGKEVMILKKIYMLMMSLMMLNMMKNLMRRSN